MVDEIQQVEMVEAKPKKRRKATLADVKPSFLIVEMDDVDEDGEPIVIEFKMRVLSYFRFNEIGKMVNDPSPATIGIDPSTKRPLFDTNSADFRNRLNDAANERSILRLAESLVEPEIPGDTLQEKTAWMKDNMPTAIVQQLIYAMGSTLTRGEARIKARADSFQ